MAEAHSGKLLQLLLYQNTELQFFTAKAAHVHKAPRRQAAMARSALKRVS